MKNIVSVCKESNNLRREVAQHPLNKNFQHILQTDKTVDEYVSWALHIVSKYDIQQIEDDLLRIQSAILQQAAYQADDSSTISLSTSTDYDDDSVNYELNNDEAKSIKPETKRTQKIENPNITLNSQFAARQNVKVVKDARLRLEMKLVKLNNSLLDNLNYYAQRATSKRQAMGSESLNSAVAMLGDTPAVIGSPHSSNKNSPITIENLPMRNTSIMTGKGVSFSPDINPQPPSTEKRSSVVSTPAQRIRKKIGTQKSTYECGVESPKYTVEIGQDQQVYSLTEKHQDNSSVPDVLQAAVDSPLPIVHEQIHSPTDHNPIIENSTPDINLEITGESSTVPTAPTEGSSEAEQAILKEIQAKKWKKINILKEFAAEEAAEALAKATAASKQQQAPVQQVDLTDPTRKFLTAGGNESIINVEPQRKMKIYEFVSGPPSDLIRKMVELPHNSLVSVTHELEEDKTITSQIKFEIDESEVSSAGQLAIRLRKTLQKKTEDLQNATAEASAQWKDSARKLSDAVNSLEESKHNLKKATAQLLDEREFQFPLKLRQRRQELHQSESSALTPRPPLQPRDVSPKAGEGLPSGSSVIAGVFLTQSAKVGPKIQAQAPHRRARPTVVEKLNLSPRAMLHVEAPTSSRDCGRQLDIISARQAEIKWQDNLAKVAAQGWLSTLLTKLRAYKTQRDALGSAVPGSIIRFLHAIKTLVVYDVQLTKDILLILIDKCIDHSEYKLGIVYEYLWTACEVFKVTASELLSRIQANRILPPPQLIADVRKEAQGHSIHHYNFNARSIHD